MVGCGGWSKRRTLYGGDQLAGREDAPLDPARDAAEDPRLLRPSRLGASRHRHHDPGGLRKSGAAAGFPRFEMGATLTGVPLYRAPRLRRAPRQLGAPLPDGTALPIVRMEKTSEGPARPVPRSCSPHGGCRSCLDRETLLRLTVALDAARELITVVDATPAERGRAVHRVRQRGVPARDRLRARRDRRPPGRPAARRGDESLRQQFRQATEAGKAFSLTTRARRKDGSTFAYEAQGQPFFRDDGTYAGRIAIGRNVEERNALRDRLASVVSALEHADDNVFVVEAHERRRQLPGLVRQRVGRAAHRLHAPGVRALLDPHPQRAADRQALRLRALADLRAGRKARIELLLYRKDGSTYWSELSATPIADEQGGSRASS